MRANLIKLADAARSGQPLPGDLAIWLIHGIDRYIKHGDSLEMCLKLSRTDGLVQRNAALAQAWALIDAPNDWKRAQAMADTVKRFRSIWPSGAKRGIDSGNAVEEALHRAFSSGQKIPSTPRQFWNLLR